MSLAIKDSSADLEAHEAGEMGLDAAAKPKAESRRA